MEDGVENYIMSINNKQEAINNSSNQQIFNSNSQLNLLKIHKPDQQSKRLSSKDNSYFMLNQPFKPSSQVKRLSNNQLYNDQLKEKNSSANLFGKPKKKRAQWKRKIDKILNSLPVIIFMSLISLFSLFAADIQAAWLPIGVDDSFNIIQCIILVLFLLELILNCLASDDYPLSYFFWLDLIAGLSMIQDIDFIMNDIIGYQPITLNAVGGRKKNVDQATKLIASVSSASRTVRVLKIIKILKLIRMVKLYKNVYIATQEAERNRTETIKMRTMEKVGGNSSEISTSGSKSNCRDNKLNHKSLKLLPISEHREEEEISHTYQPSSPYRTKLNYAQKHKFTQVSQIKVEELDNEELLHESTISKMLTTSTNKKLVILLLSVLIIFSLLSNDFFSDDSAITYTFLSALLANNYQILFPFSNYSRPGEVNITVLFDSSFPPINITWNNNPVYVNELYLNKELRFKEVRSIFSDDASIQIVYSIRTETKLIGILNIIQTIFVCICMGITSIRFEIEATKYVLHPLEVIIEIVQKVARDPVNAKNEDELQSGIKASVEKLSKEVSINYEIQVIKAAIIKISALLAIGFGDAGGEIIKENLSSNHELNPLIKGKLKTAIFGFCDIRDFDKINIALEESSIVFVNQIAEIVHSSVDRFKGATNKNIGEAFFNVWKFYTDLPNKASSNCIPSISDNLLEIDPNNPKISIVADCSVLAFLRIILKINKNYKILSYRKKHKILHLIPDYKVTMGFGLHLGYAIEGAIGSSYKIDASYLSPNVNIAARLESATRQFGVHLLISGTLYAKLSNDLKAICRYIDCVIVKGSQQILDLYTIDLNCDVTPEREKTICVIQSKIIKTIYAEKKALLQSYIDQFGSVTRLILEKDSYMELIKKRDSEFIQNWDQAIFSYKCGDWKEAETYLLKCQSVDKDDGPTKALYSYIKARNCNSPEGWYGVRELTKK